MAKLADALDLGSNGAIRAGSSPVTRTSENVPAERSPLRFLNFRTSHENLKSRGLYVNLNLQSPFSSRVSFIRPMNILHFTLVIYFNRRLLEL